MTNIQQFLEEQVRKFCSEADDSMFPVELHKSYEELVNFILSEVEREVNKKPTAYFLAGEAFIRSQDIEDSINNLRVK